MTLPSGQESKEADESDMPANARPVDIAVQWPSSLRSVETEADPAVPRAQLRAIVRAASTLPSTSPPIPHTQEERDTLEAELGVMRARVATMYDPRVITPSNKYLAQWDVATSTALVFTAVVTPVEVAFVRAGDTSFVSSPLALLNRLVDVIFIIDIGVQFHLAYFNDLGKLVRSRPTISRHYLHGWCASSRLPSRSLPCTAAAVVTRRGK